MKLFYRKHDEKCLCVLFETIILHAHENHDTLLKYKLRFYICAHVFSKNRSCLQQLYVKTTNRRLNVTNLRKVLDNDDLCIKILTEIGFILSDDEKYLEYDIFHIRNTFHVYRELRNFKLLSSKLSSLAIKVFNAECNKLSIVNLFEHSNLTAFYKPNTIARNWTHDWLSMAEFLLNNDNHNKLDGIVLFKQILIDFVYRLRYFESKPKKSKGFGLDFLGDGILYLHKYFDTPDYDSIPKYIFQYLRTNIYELYATKWHPPMLMLIRVLKFFKTKEMINFMKLRDYARLKTGNKFVIESMQKEWQCYNYKCNALNTTQKNAFDCNRLDLCEKCQESINPMFFAKVNDSKTFFVAKPFGIRIVYQGKVRVLFAYFGFWFFHLFFEFVCSCVVVFWIVVESSARL